MRVRRWLLCWFGLCLLIAACEDVARAAEPVWNKQACAHCHMLLSEPRYAAQLIAQNGERMFFDDVGCMAAQLAGSAPGRAWVHTEDGWETIDKASFSAGATTPMAYGFVASRSGSLDFASVARAVSTARAKGNAK